MATVGQTTLAKKTETKLTVNFDSLSCLQEDGSKEKFKFYTSVEIYKFA